MQDYGCQIQLCIFWREENNHQMEEYTIDAKWELWYSLILVTKHKFVKFKHTKYNISMCYITYMTWRNFYIGFMLKVEAKENLKKLNAVVAIM